MAPGQIVAIAAQNDTDHPLQQVQADNKGKVNNKELEEPVNKVKASASTTTVKEVRARPRKGSFRLVVDFLLRDPSDHKQVHNKDEFCYNDPGPRDVNHQEPCRDNILCRSRRRQHDRSKWCCNHGTTRVNCRFHY